MRSFVRILAAVVICGGLQTVVAADPGWQGRKLSDYLEMLNSHGYRIIYSNELVIDAFTLSVEPGDGDPGLGLAALLKPFSLAAVPGPEHSLLVVKAAPVDDSPVKPAFNPRASIPIPEIVVTSSLHRLDYSKPANYTYLGRELATRIPTTADEAVRLTTRVPGTANGGISSKSHVRGGNDDEVLFLFDGLRLYEPYHLKDFQAIATIINSNAIGGMDFYTGAFPARFGDRMSGVLNIELREPVEPVETELALSVFNASLMSAGRFGSDERGDWLFAGRRGNLDLVFDVVDPDLGSPVYQDYLAHVGWDFASTSRLSVNLLVSDDDLVLADVDRGERANATYSNKVFWLKWQADWSAALQSTTIAAYSDISNRRIGSLDLPGIVSGTLNDNGHFRALEFRQDWSWVISREWMLRFGVDLKQLDASYRFSSLRVIAPPFDSLPGNAPVSSNDIALAPSGAQYAAYTEFRWRPSKSLTVDLGLRRDQQNYTTVRHDKQYSRRASLLYQPDRKFSVKLSWGQYHQAQEINELQVSDGVANFFPAERADHLVFSVQREVNTGYDLSLLFYTKKYRKLHPRFENSFNSLTLLPELQFDRVRVDAAKAEAKGAEFTLTHGSASDDLLWWLGYVWSEVEDVTADGRVKRSWDQTNTVKAGLSWRWKAWYLSMAGEAHSGWPRTLLEGQAVTLADGSQGLALQATERNSSNYPVFYTLDARVSRKYDVARGDLTVFLEISNLFNRANACCTEYSVNANGLLNGHQKNWLRLVPSLGVVWHF